MSVSNKAGSGPSLFIYFASATSGGDLARLHHAKCRNIFQSLGGVGAVIVPAAVYYHQTFFPSCVYLQEYPSHGLKRRWVSNDQRPSSYHLP